MHLWLRHETRANERRAALTPQGACTLRKAGYQVTVEKSPDRVFSDADYAAAGCQMVPAQSWSEAPKDTIILGLKELPEENTPLRHRHIMFGHAFKGQHSGQALLERFRAGGGTLLDLEYLVDENGRRVSAFGYWAGFAGAAISVMGYAGPVSDLRDFADKAALVEATQAALGAAKPRAIVIGALGRVGQGAADLCGALGLEVLGWDMAETAHGGPFPEILDHELFFNCILARPDTPVFVGPQAAADPSRKLRVIGDIACDPDSDYNPVPLYRTATSWAVPLIRVHEAPPLDVMAIDNLPSLLPRESAKDFAAQLLPHLSRLDTPTDPVWSRAEQTFARHLAAL